MTAPVEDGWDGYYKPTVCNAKNIKWGRLRFILNYWSAHGLADKNKLKHTLEGLTYNKKIKYSLSNNAHYINYTINLPFTAEI